MESGSESGQSQLKQRQSIQWTVKLQRSNSQLWPTRHGILAAGMSSISSGILLQQPICSLRELHKTSRNAYHHMRRATYNHVTNICYSFLGLIGKGVVWGYVYSRCLGHGPAFPTSPSHPSIFLHPPFSHNEEVASNVQLEVVSDAIRRQLP